MTPTGNHSPILRWWLFFTIICIGLFVLVSSGALRRIFEMDVTKISFLIIAVFFVFTVRTGMKTYRLTRSAGFEDSEDDEVGWFVSDMLLTLGMIGTVIGFIYMLGTSFQGFDPGDTHSLKRVMTRMGTGMSTALYTTAAGLICSLLLKLQLFNFSHRLERSAAGRAFPE